MYIDEQGHKFRNIFLFKEENPDYFAGWYFSDECEQLNGPFNSLSEARRELRLYTQRLSQKKFDYDTFSNSRIYKTLPYIVDRVNEMDRYKQAQVSKYFNSLNKECLILGANKSVYYTKRELFGSVIFDKVLTKKVNDYIKNLVIQDYLKRIDKQFSKYDPTFVSYIKNFTKAKITRLQ